MIDSLVAFHLHTPPISLSFRFLFLHFKIKNKKQNKKFCSCKSLYNQSENNINFLLKLDILFLFSSHLSLCDSVSFFMQTSKSPFENKKKKKRNKIDNIKTADLLCHSTRTLIAVICRRKLSFI